MSSYFDQARYKAWTLKEKRAYKKAVWASDASVVLTLPDETQVHGTCLRQQFYRLSEVPQSDPEDPVSNFVTKVGESVHTEVAEVFANAEQLIDKEVRIWIDEIQLSGRIDLLIKPDNEIVGVEVKSVGGYYNTLGVIRQTRNVPKAPKIGHLAQTLVYAEHMYKHSNGAITKWIILYIDRESGESAEHEIQYVDSNTVFVNGEPSSITPSRIYSRWDQLWKSVDAHLPPPRDYEIQFSMPKLIFLADRGRLNKVDTKTVKNGKLADKGDQECRRCQWKTVCWSPKQ